MARRHRDRNDLAFRQEHNLGVPTGIMIDRALPATWKDNSADTQSEIINMMGLLAVESALRCSIFLEHCGVLLQSLNA
jgi:hypothetical protein